MCSAFGAWRETINDAIDWKICVEEAPICCHVTGKLSRQRFLSCLKVCRRGCHIIIQFGCQAAEKSLQHLRD